MNCFVEKFHQHVAIRCNFVLPCQTAGSIAVHLPEGDGTWRVQEGGRVFRCFTEIEFRGSHQKRPENFKKKIAAYFHLKHWPLLRFLPKLPISFGRRRAFNSASPSRKADCLLCVLVSYSRADLPPFCCCCDRSAVNQKFCTRIVARTTASSAFPSGRLLLLLAAPEQNPLIIPRSVPNQLRHNRLPTSTKSFINLKSP